MDHRRCAGERPVVTCNDRFTGRFPGVVGGGFNL
jgi:hypothetical protein